MTQEAGAVLRRGEICCCLLHLTKHGAEAWVCIYVWEVGNDAGSTWEGEVPSIELLECPVTFTWWL